MPVISALERPRQVDHKVRTPRPSWLIQWNPISTKSAKISWAWWYMPVVPATWEAEAEELLEIRKWKLQWARIGPLQSSLVIEQDSMSKKKISWVSWQAPVIPATREAEAGESFQPGRWKLQWAESTIALQPGQQEWNSVLKKKLSVNSNKNGSTY